MNWKDSNQGSAIQEVVFQRETLHVKIAENIQDLIMDHRLNAGDKLPPERELIGLFHVSRTTVREAIRLLQERGLVQMMVGKGTFVRQVSDQTVVESIERFYSFGRCSHLELLTLRAILEPETAALAASNATDKEMAKLETIYKKITDPSFCREAESQAAGDVEFHETLSEMTHNKLISAITHGLHKVLRHWLKNQVTLDDEYTILHAHSAIVEAVTQRDPEKARHGP